MKFSYNAPVTLSFALLCVISLFGGVLFLGDSYGQYFSVPGSLEGVRWNEPTTYFRLFSYSIGHANPTHLFGNLSILLLLGPMLEEKHGSKSLLFIILITVFLTGIINALFFKENLLGASGVVFMMILLSSFANIKKGEIPITLVAVLFLFVGKEVLNSFEKNQVSEFAHLLGATCGAIYGFKKA